MFVYSSYECNKAARKAPGIGVKSLNGTITVPINETTRLQFNGIHLWIERLHTFVNGKRWAWNKDIDGEIVVGDLSLSDLGDAIKRLEKLLVLQ
jgi:hypothetical protein